MTINHVHLGASDLAATQSFYERMFSFEKERDHGRGVFMRDAGGFLIALDPIREPVEFPSWFHLGFCMQTADEVLASHRRAVDAGERIVRELLTEPGQFASFYLTDPDGRWIEVSWHAE